MYSNKLKMSLCRPVSGNICSAVRLHMICSFDFVFFLRFVYMCVLNVLRIIIISATSVLYRWVWCCLWYERGGWWLSLKTKAKNLNSFDLNYFFVWVSRFKAHFGVRVLTIRLMSLIRYELLRFCCFCWRHMQLCDCQSAVLWVELLILLDANTCLKTIAYSMSIEICVGPHYHPLKLRFIINAQLKPIM